MFGVILVIGLVFVIVSRLDIKTDNHRLRARHILVEDYKTAKTIIEMLEAGEDFCDLTVEYSKDTVTANNCGDIGYFEKGVMVIEFEEAVKYNKYTKCLYERIMVIT